VLQLAKRRTCGVQRRWNEQFYPTIDYGTNRRRFRSFHSLRDILQAKSEGLFVRVNFTQLSSAKPTPRRICHGETPNPSRTRYKPSVCSRLQRITYHTAHDTVTQGSHVLRPIAVFLREPGLLGIWHDHSFLLSTPNSNQSPASPPTEIVRLNTVTFSVILPIACHQQDAGADDEDPEVGNVMWGFHNHHIPLPLVPEYASAGVR